MEEREGAKLWPFEPAQEGEREREREGEGRMWWSLTCLDVFGCVWDGRGREGSPFNSWPGRAGPGLAWLGFWSVGPGEQSLQREREERARRCDMYSG